MNTKLLFNKRTLINLSIVALIYIFLYQYVAYQQSYSTPFDALENTASKNDELFMVKEIIASSKGTDQAVIFFINKKNSVSVSLFQKGLWGWQNTVMTSGDLSVENVDPNVLVPSVSGAGGILYGLTASPKIDHVLVDKQVAVQIPVSSNLRHTNLKLTPNLKLWYVFSDKVTTDSKIEVMDHTGKIIET